MSITRTVPYKQAQPSSVTSEPWLLELSGQQANAGEAIEDWDPATSICLLRRVRVDLDAVRQQCGLPVDARVTLGAFWRCEGTTLRGHGTRFTSEVCGVLECTLSLEIEGHALAGSITVHAALGLNRTLEPSPLRARRAGTVLWEDQKTILLEGGGARFPMEVRSFANSGWQFPPRAAWYFDLDNEQWEIPVLGGMRLHLNQDHPAVIRYLEDPSSVEAVFFYRTLHFDVGRQLIRAALASESFIEREERWPRNSVGDAVSRLIRFNFRGETLGALANRMQQEPNFFDAQLQGALDAWWEES